MTTETTTTPAVSEAMTPGECRFIEQPEFLLPVENPHSTSRIEVRTYLAGADPASNSVDLRVTLMTSWPTSIRLEMSLTAEQAVALCDRVMAAAKVILDTQTQPAVTEEQEAA